MAHVHLICGAAFVRIDVDCSTKDKRKVANKIQQMSGKKIER